MTDGNNSTEQDKSSWPDWLRAATTRNARVEVSEGRVVWHDGLWLGGEWYDGEWRGGEWCGGTWRDGVWYRGVWHGGVWHNGEWYRGVWLGGEWRTGDWRGGTWRDGVWYRGVWHGGEWCGGEWRGGTWLGGEWHGGEWRDGEWHGVEDRILFMAARMGIVFDNEGKAHAYRTVNKDCTGRWNPTFVQKEGQVEVPDAAPAGVGTCQHGLHVTDAATAWQYFGKDLNCRFVKVTFTRKQLLDCDGNKARISGGYCEFIDRPF